MKCALAISDFIPHKLVRGLRYVDLDVWCNYTEGMAPLDLARRFVQIRGVLVPAAVIAPAPGELAPANLVEAKVDQYTYYVDESGDLTLFGRKRRIVVGQNGISRTFMLGAAYVQDSESLNSAFSALRQEILSDPSLSHIESLKPERRRTALYFHAKDDHRLVRERVFEVLATQRVSVLAVMRRKTALAAAAVAKGGEGPPNFVEQKQFDSMITSLFADRLQLAKRSDIFIAKRGSSDRNAQLTAAVESAKAKFEKKWGVVNPHEFHVQAAQPTDHAGLQAIDYYLWALQRAVERNEWDTFQRHQAAFRLIVDVDDRSKRKTGVYYAESNPLTPAAIKPFES